MNNILLESGSVLNSPLAMWFLPELHLQKNNDFIGSCIGQCEMNPCETCLNCFYPRCLHGHCQDLLQNGYGRGLRELEVLNTECRNLLLLFLGSEPNRKIIENDDEFVQFVFQTLSKRTK